MISNIIFDLDGTLIDTTVGILRCMVYSLEQMNRPCPDNFVLREALRASIFPTYRKLLNTDDENVVNEGVRHFRKRYSEIGVYENEVYPGIPEVLGELHGEGYGLYIATIKARDFSEKIISRHGLDLVVSGIFAPELDDP